MTANHVTHVARLRCGRPQMFEKQIVIDARGHLLGSCVMCDLRVITALSLRQSGAAMCETLAACDVGLPRVVLTGLSQPFVAALCRSARLDCGKRASCWAAGGSCPMRIDQHFGQLLPKQAQVYGLPSQEALDQPEARPVPLPAPVQDLLACSPWNAPAQVAPRPGCAGPAEGEPPNRSIGG